MCHLKRMCHLKSMCHLKKYINILFQFWVDDAEYNSDELLSKEATQL